jgi:hypothetical protein
MELVKTSLKSTETKSYHLAVTILFENLEYQWHTNFVQEYFFDARMEKIEPAIKRREHHIWSNDARWSDLKSSQKRKMKKIANTYFDETFKLWQNNELVF